jgi:hypothetical protein
MQFKASFIAAICLVATPALGFLIPEGQGDGVYTATKDENGTYVHTKIGDLPAEVAARKPRSRIMKRTFDSMYCAGQVQSSEYGSVDAANGGLSSQCAGDGISIGKLEAAYTISGDIVAFFCNYNPNNNYCTASAFSDALGALDNSCGWYGAGTARDNYLNVAYGWEFNSADFCGF